jgi:hypothetical protein
VLQISAGAKTKCKMTARIPAFDLKKWIFCAAWPSMAKLRKTWNFRRFSWLVKKRDPPRKNFGYWIFHFLLKFFCGAFAAILSCLSVATSFLWLFGPVSHKFGYGLDTRGKITKTQQTLPNMSSRDLSKSPYGLSRSFALCAQLRVSWVLGFWAVPLQCTIAIKNPHD